MKSKVFTEEELVNTYDDDWNPPSGWERVSDLSPPQRRSLCLDLSRRLHDHRAAVTLIDMTDPADPQRTGSGVLVRGYDGYGILTAGHVCAHIENRDLPTRQSLWCVPLLAEKRSGEPFRKLHLRNVEMAYSKHSAVPDYGCLVMPQSKGRDAEAWGTFVNITKDGPSRKSATSMLEHDAWMSAGYLEEKSTGQAIFAQYLFGAPEAIYARGGVRYFYTIDRLNEPGLPKRINGMSGSGLWRLRVTRRVGKEANEIGSPILKGINFRQEHTTNREPLAFYAHDLESIADTVVRWLDTPRH